MAMDSFKLSTQVIDFQKQMWDNWNITLNVIEKQTSSAVHWAIRHTYWIPNERRKKMENYWSACLKERVRFKTYVDEGYNNLKKSLSETRAPVKPKNHPSQSKS